MKEYAKDFYKSAAWKRARQTVIKRANGLCERCRAAGLYRPGVIVHHKDYITPENIHNPGVTLSLDNLEYLCEDCHNKEHKAKPNNRYRFDSKFMSIHALCFRCIAQFFLFFRSFSLFILLFLPCNRLHFHT